MRKNLRIRLGDIVSVHSVDCQYGERIQILPFSDTIEVRKKKKKKKKKEKRRKTKIKGLIRRAFLWA